MMKMHHQQSQGSALVSTVEAVLLFCNFAIKDGKIHFQNKLVHSCDFLEKLASSSKVHPHGSGKHQ